MNVAAAPPPSSTPVADGGAAAIGQATAAPTGFDALLALVDGAIGNVVAQADAATTDQTPAEQTPADTALPAADPMLAALAALMIPQPIADVAVEVAVEAAPAVSAVVADAGAALADAISPDTLAADTAPVTPDLAAAIDTKPAQPALTPPAAAPEAPVATRTTAPVAAPVADPVAAPVAAQVAAAETVVAAPAAREPARETAKTETAPRAAAATIETSGKAAAEAVKTETADAVTAVAGASTGDAGLAAAADGAPPAPAAPTTNAAASTPAPVQTSEVPAVAVAAAAPVRGSPETVAKLSADILKKLDGRSTRFELALDPVGLGRVDVKIEIGAHGAVTAAMSFDTPQAAAELRGRASELRTALAAAGFDLPENALSFDVNSQAGGDRGAQTAWDFQERAEGRFNAFAGRAFEAAISGAEDLVDTISSRLSAYRADGVDVRI